MLWHKRLGNLLFGGKSPVSRYGEWYTRTEWEGKILTPPIIYWKHRVTVVLLQPKITFPANVYAAAGGETEEAPSHMCREITVKSGGRVPKAYMCVCLGGSY